MIKYLRSLKRKIDHESPSDELLDDLYETILNRWVDKDYYEDDISDSVNQQLELMNEVVKIHTSENNQLLANSLNNQIDATRIRYLKYPKKAYQIYSMKLDKETVFIGDLHSDAYSLYSILKKVSFLSKVVNNEIQLVFLGDYVDRGKNHFEIIDFILSLKFLFPRQVILLRGNHDSGYIDKDDQVNTQYRVMDFEDHTQYFPHFIRKVESNPYLLHPVLPTYNHFFDSLAYIAFIRHDKGVYMACHGGIPRPNIETDSYFSYIKKLSDLTDTRIRDYIGRSIVSNIIWSDPLDGELVRWDNGRFSFNSEFFVSFRKKINIEKMFRGHVAEVNGIKEHFDGQVITVYSTGGKLVDGLNTNTAYPQVTPKIAVIKDSVIKYENF
jgi:hypothetical protein